MYRCTGGALPPRADVQNELTAKILKSIGNMTMVIDNLEKNHLVLHQRNPEDRRMITVSLTDLEKQLIANILPKYVAVIMVSAPLLQSAAMIGASTGT